MPPREAVVLAAGLGTRMRPLTDQLPKPALPFLNRPALHWTLEALAAAGAKRAVLNLHHLPKETAACARAGAAGLELRFSTEPEILGTAGAFWPMRGLLKGPLFFVVNGDLWGELPLAALEAELEGHPECLAALAVRPLPEGAPYTPVEVDRTGALRGFGAGRHFFTGVYAARKELLQGLPGPGFRELVRDLLRPLLPSGAVRAVSHAGRWCDLGTPATYLSAQLDALAEVAAGALAVPEGSTLERRAGHPVLLGERASLSRDATVEGPLVLGARCKVAPGCTLGRAVLLPGTVLPEGERLRGAIAWGALRIDAR